ncbi:MAG TPA: hypothetical protein VHC22_16150 [Pirellulales bacterium]|nr:hypothetical protein [Pirellulales bacterium]
MTRPLQFSLWQLMLAMTVTAVGAAWIPRIFPYGSGRFTVFMAAAIPVSAMFLVAHFFRGVSGFSTGVVLGSLPCLFFSVMCEVTIINIWERSIGPSLCVPLGIVLGGLIGGALTAFLAGAAGGIVAMLYDELS